MIRGEAPLFKGKGSEEGEWKDISETIPEMNAVLELFFLLAFPM